MRRVALFLGALLLLTVFWPHSAEARCWWNGYRWHCSHYRHHYWRYGYWYPRYHYRPYYSRFHYHYRPYYYGYYRSYYRPVCTPWPLCWG